MDRLFKMKVDGVEYNIDMRGNGLLVDEVPFVVGTQDDLVTIDGIAFKVEVRETAAIVDGKEYALELSGIRLRQPARKLDLDSAKKEAGAGAVTALMPGVIVRILVEAGQAVKVGDVLLILEAMKMENEIQSERDGVIKKIHISPGDKVETGQPLVDIGDA